MQAWIADTQPDSRIFFFQLILEKNRAEKEGCIDSLTFPTKNFFHKSDRTVPTP